MVQRKTVHCRKLVACELMAGVATIAGAVNSVRDAETATLRDAHE